MPHFRRQLLLKSFKLADIFILISSFAVATMISYRQLDAESFERFLSMRLSVQNFFAFLGFILVWHIIFSAIGLYHSMRLSSRWLEAIDIFKATTVGTATMLFVSVIFDMSMVTPLFLIVFWETATLFTLLSRILLRITLGRVRVKGHNLRIILLGGTNQRVIRYARKIEEKPELGYKLAGFIDNEWISQPEERWLKEAPLLQLEDLPDYLRDNVIDEVVIGFPMKSQYDRYSQVIDLCAEQGINVRIIGDLFFTRIAKSRIENFEGNPTITLYTGSVDYGSLMIKRVVDIILSFSALIVLFPVFILIALAIKFSSKGPVFFSQQRLGLNKRLFNLYKFRTMVVGAEKMQKDLEELNEADGPVFKIKNDPRITPIGQFLRKSSLDELPQLFNVLKGDMSLVGPRPLPIRDYKEFDQRWFTRRFSVRPGLTCFWQINGRSDVPFMKWIELDLRYIDTWSLKLDFLILLKTIPAVLKGAGAT